MADLRKHDDRESWIRWARQFVLRGLRPIDVIIVHGPHTPPANCHWGEAVCTFVDDPEAIINVSFRSRVEVRKYDAKNVIMWSKDILEEGETFRLLKSSELSRRARRWLKAADHQLEKFRKQRVAIAKRLAELRDRLNQTVIREALKPPADEFHD